MKFKKAIKTAPPVKQSRVQTLARRRENILSVFGNVLSDLKNVNQDLKQCISDSEKEIARIQADRISALDMLANNETVINNIQTIVGK